VLISTRKCGINLIFTAGMRAENQQIKPSKWLNIYLESPHETSKQEVLKRLPNRATIFWFLVTTASLTTTGFDYVFNYMTLELKVVSDCRQYYGYKFSWVLSLRSKSRLTVNSLLQDLSLTKNVKAIKISIYTHSYWWVDQNEAKLNTRL